MCRIVVWAKPGNDHPDPLIDARKFKRGMVVDILEDGQEAGKEIESGSWWRIIEVPGEPASQFGDLLGGDPEFNSELFAALNPLPRKRVQRLDLDAIESAAGAKQAGPITLTRSAVTVLAKPSLRRDNPNVIGKSTVTPEIG